MERVVVMQPQKKWPIFCSIFYVRT